MNRYQVKVWFSEEDIENEVSSIEMQGENMDELVDMAISVYEDIAVAVEVENELEELVYHISPDNVIDNRSNFI